MTAFALPLVARTFPTLLGVSNSNPEEVGCACPDDFLQLWLIIRRRKRVVSQVICYVGLVSQGNVAMSGVQPEAPAVSKLQIEL
jgi:hypothetical protein